MFKAFYELTHTPFTRAIPTEELYPARCLEETVGRLMYAAERQWFAVVTGDPGIGKTTVIRRFASLLDPAKHKLLYLADSKLTPRNFYKGLLDQLGCEAKFYRGDAKRQLHREIEVMRAVHHLAPVVIVDEAHLLDKEMAEEIRFMLNCRMDSESPMALMLVGQSELWERLQLQTYAAIRQRIDLQCKLYHFDQAETNAYIDRHMAYAGANHPVFTLQAMEEIYRYSSGTARLVNKACTQCLMYGSQNRFQLVDDHMVRLVVSSELS